MRFAFILDPLETLKDYKDTSIAMMRARSSAATRCMRSCAKRWHGATAR